MKATPEQLILQQIQALCQGHAQALRDALQDMALLALTPAQYSQLSKADRRLLDQFATATPGCKTTWARASCLRF
jgi:hypothetical protein